MHVLIHDLQKKNLQASTRSHDPFSDNPKIWPTFIYRGEVPAHTFAKLPVRALINDPKKLFQKKVYVTIPQWFETFPNMSDLQSGRNRAKCGLVLNDPIDWFKLRLNQPITPLNPNWNRKPLHSQISLCNCTSTNITQIRNTKKSRQECSKRLKRIHRATFSVLCFLWMYW